MDNLGILLKLKLANQITILRILLIVPFLICMITANGSSRPVLVRYTAVFLFFVMAVSDFLDGYLARKYNQVSSLGTFLDPLADKLLMTVSCILLASEKTAVPGFVLPPVVVVFIIGKDVLLLLGFVIVYLVTLDVHIKPAAPGKTSTFFQLSMVLAILIAPEMVSVAGWWRYLLPFLWWGAASLAILSTFVYIKAGIRYIEEFEE